MEFKPHRFEDVTIEGIDNPQSEHKATVFATEAWEGDDRIRLPDLDGLSYFQGFAVLGNKAYFVQGALAYNLTVVAKLNRYESPVEWEEWSGAERYLSVCTDRLRAHMENLQSTIDAGLKALAETGCIPHRHGREESMWNTDFSNPTASTFTEQAQFIESQSGFAKRYKAIVEAKKSFGDEISLLLNPESELV